MIKYIENDEMVVLYLVSCQLYAIMCNAHQDGMELDINLFELAYSQDQLLAAGHIL
jgi:hypothetical protein